MTLKQYLIVETLKADHFDAEDFRLNPKDRMLPNGPNEQYSRMEKNRSTCFQSTGTEEVG